MRFALWLLAAALPLLASSDTRLIDALKRRDMKAFETLLGAGADVNGAAPDGATPLAWAVFLDMPDVAGKLIDRGANVNAKGDYGETPLTLALANGNAALSERLLKAGADSKAMRWNSETALMIAAGAGSVAEVQMLLDRGADVNAVEPKRQQNALMWAASEGHTAVVELLITKGANVNSVSKGGFTPLVFAALKNDAVSVRRMIKAGANANHTLPDQSKVLTAVMSNRSYDAALALLEGGADPNVADKTKNTPLHIAAQAGSLELVKTLIAKGAKLNERTSPIEPTPGSFRQQAGEQTPLLLAARANKPEVMRALIEKGADITIKAQDSATLLLAAAASGRVQAAKCAYEFDKDVKAVDRTGKTAMHLVVGGGGGASQAEMTETVQFLADIGVPLDQKDSRGRTPIQLGDFIPLNQPINLMTELIVSRGGKPLVYPKEYVKPRK